MLRFLTAGESHGQKLVAILDGFPAGVDIDIDDINNELHLRQIGFGRSQRQKIENDTVYITSGVRFGKSTGAPISLEIENKDHKNWQLLMKTSKLDESEIIQLQKEFANKIPSSFRPGHADLAGLLKFKHSDIRNVIERASARQTAIKVAIGSICNQLLKRLKINLTGYVHSIKDVSIDFDSQKHSIETINELIVSDTILCPDKNAQTQMIELITQARKNGDSLGGVVEVLADGIPIGLGSYTQWDKKIDGLLAQSIMSIQAVKAVSIGNGIEAGKLNGSQFHDEIYLNDNTIKSKSNNAGGVEGGMTNGQRLVIKAYMKPIPTIAKSLSTLSWPEFKNTTAFYERSDVCAVSSLAIIAKNMVSFVLCQALLEKFGHDNFIEIKQACEAYQAYNQNLINQKLNL